jgi:D-alanine-D-alanine ligase
MDKLAAKQMYEYAGLKIPPYLILTKDAPFEPDNLVDQLGMPLVIKPVAGGSSIGMSIVKSKDAIPAAVEKAFEHDRSVLVEAYLPGTELTCAVIGNDQLETYPVVEIRPGKGYDFFDYSAKYTVGATTEICPAEIPNDVTAQVQAIAVKAHTALFCRGYSRTDLILSDETLYVIETNTIPGMTRTSLLPRAAQAAGVDFSSLLDKLILLCLEDYSSKSHIRNSNRLDRILRAMPVLST